MLRGIRAWARRHTARRRYSPVGIAFHWSMAAVIVIMLWLGWYMGRLEAGAAKRAAFDIHMLTGSTTLMLGVLRLIWRLFVTGPVNDADRVAGIAALLAKGTHVAFYACFIGLPVSGWIMWSAFAPGATAGAAGLLQLPPLPLEDLGFQLRAWLQHAARLIHEGLALVLVVLIPLHVAAALKHHFVDQHDVLTAMLPETMTESSPTAPKQATQPQ